MLQRTARVVACCTVLASVVGVSSASADEVIVVYRQQPGSSYELAVEGWVADQLAAEAAAAEAARVAAAAAEAARLEEERRAAASALPAQQAATAAAPVVTSGDGIFPSVDYWLAIHRCEQGDSWTAYGRFGNGLMGGGGLGISDGAWVSWGGLEFAANASLATPEQQMIVASRGYRMYGGSPWGCRV